MQVTPRPRWRRVFWRGEINAVADKLCKGTHENCQSFDWLQEKVFHVSQKPFLKQCNTNLGIALFGKTSPEITNVWQHGHLCGHRKNVMKPKDINVVQIDS